MERRLCQALDSLRLADGQPDYQSRKTNLTFLAGELALNELRHFKELLSHAMFQKDLIFSLPVEVVISISDYLGLRDILVCLAVSKGWRNKFSNERVSFALVDRLFPSLAHEKLTAERKGLRFDITSSLITAVRRSLKRVEARCSSRNDIYFRWSGPESYFVADEGEYSRFENDNFLPDQPVVYLRPGDYVRGTQTLYNHGRIAWHPEMEDVLIVDCLHTKRRKIFSFPGVRMLGPHFHLFGLGDKLVVARVDRYLLAWEIEKDRSHKRVTLPCAPVKCTTSGHNIAVLTHNKDLLVWNFDQGSLLPITLPAELSTTHLTNIDITAHPDSKTNTVLMSTLSVGHELPLQASVYEWKDRKLVGVFSFEAPIPYECGRVAFKKSNSYGLYEIGILWPTVKLENRFCTIQFDAYNKIFSHQYWLDSFQSAMLNPNDDCHLWNDRLAIPSRRVERESISIYQLEPKTPAYGSDPSIRQPLELRTCDTYIDGTIVGPDHDFMIRGDDDFFLIIGHSGFTVWSF